MDAILTCNIWVYILSLLLIVLFIISLKIYPETKKNNYKVLVYLLLSFIIIHSITPFLLGKKNKELTWSTWKNPRNIYINFNDNNNLNDTNSSPDPVNSFLNEKENNQSQNNNMNMGLGSMFDGAQTPSSSNVPSYTPSGDNVLISNIHENNIKPAENKFLPNFDNAETNNFTNNPYQDNNNFNNSEPQNNFNNNFDIPTSLNNNMDAPLGSANTFTDFNALNQPMTNNYMPNDNQGNLFNQPLNIVDVPETKKEEIKEEAFDNPFDDAYENILFAKPVPVNPQSTQTETPAPQESNDSNSDNNDDNSENYISIDHQRTLFSTRDAVLELKKTTDRIKADGINLDSEEIDFDDYYQIIIKIKK